MRIWETARNLLFPPRCGSCRKLIGWEAPYGLCDVCRAEVQFIAAGYFCRICGRPLSHDWGICGECRTVKRHYDLHLSCCCYEKSVRSMILQLKFSPAMRQNARYLGQMMIDRIEAYDGFPVPDLVTCVPISPKKLEERGYNQSALLALTVAKHFKWKASVKAILKIRETATQSKLSRRERMENVRGAFGIVSREAIAGKRVLLVDDVYTTGATVNEIAKVLKRNGAREVIVLTAAMTPP